MKMWKPFLMGGFMAPMMLWMLHGILTDQGSAVGAAGLLFVGAHILLVGVAAVASIWAARLSPRVRHWLERLHRPSATHIMAILTGAVLVGITVHLTLHSGVI